MFKNTKIVALLVALSGCGYVDAYEEAVYDREPLYCYKSLGAVQCFKEPQHHDKLRLVNYFGPHPSRYDEPEPPEVPELQAPKEIEHWVKDPEPVPKPAVRMQDLPKRPAGASTVGSVAEAEHLRYSLPEAPVSPVRDNENPVGAVAAHLEGEI